jgi:resuscitation-promoting factor RpfA
MGEAAARPLDVPLDLDRRAARRLVEAPTDPDRTRDDLTARLTPPARPVPGELGRLADLDNSQWDLGRAEPGPGEPAFAAFAPPHAPATAMAPFGDGLPDVDVEVLEIRLRPAPAGRRLASWVIDGIPFLVLLGYGVNVAVGLPGIPEGPRLEWSAGALALSIGAAVAILLFVYQTLAHALAGATLGKRLLGLRVVGPDGRRPSIARSAARALAGWVSLAFLGLGPLLALFTDSGRAVHDLLARTWVVRAP